MAAISHVRCSKLDSYSRPHSVGPPTSKRTAPGRLLTTGQLPRIGFLTFSAHRRGPNIAPWYCTLSQEPLRGAMLMTEKKLTQGSGRFKSLPWIGMAALSGLMLPPRRGQSMATANIPEARRLDERVYPWLSEPKPPIVVTALPIPRHQRLPHGSSSARPAPHGGARSSVLGDGPAEGGHYRPEVP